MWSAGLVPAWRVDGVVRDILAVDEMRGLAIAGGKLYAVALDTGVVTVQATFDKGVPTALVHAGGRVLAYGTRSRSSVAWSIDPATFAIALVELPEPAAGVATKGTPSIAASADGKRVLTCSDDRWPTVRDATTLAPLATFTGAERCASPRFVDDGRVVLDRIGGSTGARIGDIATGKVSVSKVGTPVPWPGPGGRAALVEGRKVTLEEGGRAIASYTVSGVAAPHWLADASALVSASKTVLRVLPARPGEAERTFELPAQLRRMTPIPGTPRLFFQAGAHRLGVYVPGTGTISAEGTNLGEVAKVAVAGGAVVSGAERLRVWRDGAITVTGPLAVAEMIDLDAGEPALFATLDGLFTLDVRTGAVAELDAGVSSMAADRHGDRILYDADDDVRDWARGGADVWFRRSSDFFVTDVDAASGRVAMTDDDAFYVARPEEGDLFGFHAFDCGDPLYLYLERGKERAATYDGVTVHLYDTSARKGLGGIELTDDNIEALAFVPGSDALALVGASLYLWDPVAHTVTAWPLPAEHAGFAATSLAVDAAGTQLAIGFADGAVLWARLDGVRAHGAQVGPSVATEKPPATTSCRGKAMASTLADLVGPDPGDEP